MSDALQLSFEYTPRDQLVAFAHKTAQAKAFSPEEEKQSLAKIPAGGTCLVELLCVAADCANPKQLLYVLFNSTGEVIDRKKGKSHAPSKDVVGRWWTGRDQIDLPAFEESLRVRIYDERYGQTLGEYVIRPNQQPESVCCDQFQFLLHHPTP